VLELAMRLREVEQQRIALEQRVGLLERRDRLLVLAEVVQGDPAPRVRVGLGMRIGGDARRRAERDDDDQ
jgi:hypothetical protein